MNGVLPATRVHGRRQAIDPRPVVQRLPLQFGHRPDVVADGMFLAPGFCHGRGHSACRKSPQSPVPL